jgi:polysaccharide export outer membrane protein
MANPSGGGAMCSGLESPTTLRNSKKAYRNMSAKSLTFAAAAMLAIGCSMVPEKPPLSGSTVTTTVADINRALSTLAAQSASSSSLDYQVGPEDLLEITLFNIPEVYGQDRISLTPRVTTVRVSQRGQIALPMLGGLDVTGLTVSGLEEKLRIAYDKYIVRPQVGVLVKEFRQRVSVIGAVQKPGVFELTGPKTVIDLLAMSGGINEKAGSQVQIYRNGANGRETHVIDLAVLVNSTGLINAENATMINMPVRAGDTINIPEAGMFFVDGAVRKPGSYPLGRRYSLTQGLATAGGIDIELYSEDISILRRRGPGEVQTINVDWSQVVSGAIPDPQLQPDDVIIVPTSSVKFFVKRFIGTLVGGISVGSFIR